MPESEYSYSEYARRVAEDTGDGYPRYLYALYFCYKYHLQEYIRYVRQ